MRWRLALAAVVVIACERGTPQATDRAPDTTPRTRSSGSTTLGDAKQRCRANGLWSECAVFERLERAGLAPRRDTTPESVVTEPPLTAQGILMHVGNADLELYIYRSAAARERDERELDRKNYVEYTAPLSMQSQPTLIHSVNLLAVLHSTNDHLRERVGDALTAGPPQPSK